MAAPKSAITREDIIKGISKVCSDVNSRQKDFVFAAASNLELFGSAPEGTHELFGVCLTSIDDSILTTFYFGYSTWHGRVLYLDELGIVDDDMELVSLPVELIFKVFSSIAVELFCTRLIWQHCARLKWKCLCFPQTLEGWLTLHWNQESFKRVVLGETIADRPQGEELQYPKISQIIQEILNEASQATTYIKVATRNDIDDIERLIHGIAKFENDVVKITRTQLLLDGFGEYPLYYCFLLQDISNKSTPYTYGIAFWYLGYSKVDGRFLYLEDLYIESDFRGKGVGSFVMKVLASVSQKLKCCRIVWQVIHWNTPALSFYDKLGAVVQDGFLTCRFADEALLECAAQAIEIY